MRLIAADGAVARFSSARRRLNHYRTGQPWQMAYAEEAAGRPRLFRPGGGGLLALALSNHPGRWIVTASDAQSAGLLAKELTRAIHAITAGARSGPVQPMAVPDANPAALVGLALPVPAWVSVCIHFEHAPLGMLLIGDAHLWVRDGHELVFARVHSPGDASCGFCEAASRPGAAWTRPPLLSALDRMRQPARLFEQSA